MWLTRLYQRFRHLVHEMGKFGIVGAGAYLVDTALLILLDGRGWEPMWAKTVAAIVAASLAFVGNRFWTWRDRLRSGLAREYSLYFIFNAIGLGIALACLGISYHWLGAVWPNVFQTTLAVWISANVIGLVAGTAFRFWAYRRFVFQQVVPTKLASATSTPHDS